MHDPRTLVPVPSPDSINSGLHFLTESFMRTHVGMPRDTFGTGCLPVTNERIRRHIITASVGPFRVTGYDIAVESLRNLLADVKTYHPEVYDLLGSAGMLCCRLVRGSDDTPSNHSWGYAVDLTLDGHLTPLGSETVPHGLLAIYDIVHQHRWLWGAGFRRHDPMHYEPSQELVEEWIRMGRVK